MSVKVSPISKTAALLIIAVGVFVLFTGLVAHVPANDAAGVIFIILGLVLYRLLFRFTRRLSRDVEGSKVEGGGA